MFATHHFRDQIASGILAGLIAGTLCLATMIIEVSQAKAGDLIVKYDQSQLLRLPRPAAEIIIGNPTIADVTIQASNLLVITGKSFGITNIIALDAERNVIQDQRVLVQRDEMKVVYLSKGGKRESYNCSPQCNPMITIGDDTKYFSTVANNTGRKIGMASATGNTGGGAR